MWRLNKEWKCSQVDRRLGTKRQRQIGRSVAVIQGRVHKHRSWHRLWNAVRRRWQQCRHIVNISQSCRRHCSGCSVVSLSPGDAAPPSTTSSFAASWLLQQANFGRRSLSLQCIKHSIRQLGDKGPSGLNVHLRQDYQSRKGSFLCWAADILDSFYQTTLQQFVLAAKTLFYTAISIASLSRRIVAVKML